MLDSPVTYNFKIEVGTLLRQQIALYLGYTINYYGSKV
jgi:hypothetical protein